MSDDPFNLSSWRPMLRPRCERKTEELGAFRSAAGDEWRLRLLFHGEWGCEASFTSDFGAVMARRFNTHVLAIKWAAQERAILEQGEA